MERTIPVPANPDRRDVQGTPGRPPSGRKVRQVLCRCKANPESYQELLYLDEFDPARYEDAGKNFGGVMSKEEWFRRRGEAEDRVRRWAETIKILDRSPPT